MTETTHTPLPYECFQDRSYYDMWCVRRVNEREWGKGFHLVNGEEAAALRDMLNTRAGSHHRLVEALEVMRGHGCPVCNGDCGSANPPVMSCPMLMIDAALKEAGR